MLELPRPQLAVHFSLTNLPWQQHQNNGPGFPSQLKDGLGKSKIRSSKKNGNGIALYHANEILTNWKGELILDRDFLEGAKVTIKMRKTTDVKNKEQCKILIDDDELIRKSWEMRAKDKNMSLKTFSSFEDFFKVKDLFDFNSDIFIDSNLGKGDKGELRAKTLFEYGFKKITLVTGYEAEEFREMSWIKEIRGKLPSF